ncbi:MAG: c-type cytochrome [Pseudomonadota bacterium]
MLTGIRVLAALLLVAAVAAAVVLGATEWEIRRPHAIRLGTIAVPHDAASVAEGGRIATLLGCRSCHFEGKGGAWKPVNKWWGTIAPPALARAIMGYSDAELARLIRHGVKRDGTTLFVMPAWSERYLADDDTGRVIAWLRTLKPAPDDSTAKTEFGALARFDIATGKLRPSYQPGTVAPLARPTPAGQYWAQALCSECHHMLDDQRREGQVVPGLAAAATGYDRASFRALLKTGKGKRGRELGLMSTIARENLHALRDDEIDVLHDWLTGEAKRLEGR